MHHRDRIGDPLELVKLIQFLDATFLVAIQEGSLATLSTTAPGSLGLEVFLFALFRRFSDSVLEYCDDSAAFERLGKAVWAEGVGGFAERAQQTSVNSNAPPEYVDTVSATFLDIESDLERILLNAARIGCAIGHAKASIVDLVASIATEPAVLKSLKSKWGIILKREF
jgi:hypothetical protein